MFTYLHEQQLAFMDRHWWILPATILLALALMSIQRRR
jgi:hypothetical protein